jgi:hypothetical protein
MTEPEKGMPCYHLANGKSITIYQALFKARFNGNFRRNFGEREWERLPGSTKARLRVIAKAYTEKYNEKLRIRRTPVAQNVQQVTDPSSANVSTFHGNSINGTSVLCHTAHNSKMNILATFPSSMVPTVGAKVPDDGESSTPATADTKVLCHRIDMSITNNDDSPGQSMEITLNEGHEEQDDGECVDNFEEPFESPSDSDEDEADDEIGVPYDPAEFEDPFGGVAEENGGPRHERAKFSVLWRDWCIQQQLEKKPAMEFIRELKREDPIMDLDTMQVTWKNLAKVSKKEKEDIGEILELTADDERTAKYIHLGLARMISRVLPLLLEKTFPNGDKPTAPHLRLEMWTDGCEPSRTGAQNELWPIVVCVIAIGSVYDGPHRAVPVNASKPIMVAYFLGGSKPYHGNVLLRNVVDELLVLDPRPRPMSERPKTATTQFAFTANFTATLSRFIADTPARSLFKNVYGHSSTFFCEKCDVGFERVGGVKFWNITDLNLREDHLFETYERHTRPVSIIRIIYFILTRVYMKITTMRQKARICKKFSFILWRRIFETSVMEGRKASTNFN